MLTKDHATTETGVKETVSMTYATVGSILLGLGVSLGFGLGGLYAMGDSWMQLNEVIGSYYTMTPTALVGVYLVMISVALGPSFLGLSLLFIIRLEKHLEIALPLNFLTYLITAMIIISVILSGIYLIDAFNPYIWYQPVDQIPKLNTLNQLCGCLLVAAYSVLAVAALCAIFGSRKFCKNREREVVRKSIQPNNKLFARDNLRNFAVLIASFFTIFGLTLFLPHTWAITSGNVIAWNTYFASDSPYSLISGVVLYRNEVQHFTNSSNTTTSGSDQSPYVNILSADVTALDSPELIPDPDWLQPLVYLKLYETVVVFYSVIFFIVISGIIGTYYTPFRRQLHRRINMSFIPKEINLWPLGASLGELLLTSTVIALHCYWFWYWAVGWPYRESSVRRAHEQSNLEIYARVMGQMAILTMSFLTFPVAHNSVWESVFGVPFDRAIKYHRTMGVLFWIFSTFHMLLFQIKWIRKGVLIQNAWSEPNNWIVQGTINDPLVFRNSNWTIPLMEFTWLMGTIAMSAALLRTTYRYELFVYTHIFMALFFILSFLHSFQSWYYTGAGLLLYAFDKIIRFINASRQHSIVSLEHHKDPGVTRVTLPGNTFPRGHSAGQFCWIQIPSVSAFEWHPFTISSSPCQALGMNGTVEFSIKALTTGSWTHKLSQFADKCATEKTHPAALDIALDGPYGRSFDYSEHETVVLVAGGIGITPMISTFNELATRMRFEEMGSAGSVRNVHLVWSIRHASLFDLFAREVLSPLANNLPGVFVHLFITGTPQFTVSTPDKMLESVQAAEESTATRGINDTLYRAVDVHRSILNVEKEIKSVRSSKESGTNPMSSTHNIILDTVMLDIGKNATDFAASTTNLFVSFGRPDYGQLFDKINNWVVGDSESRVQRPVGSKIGGVACMVCAPLVAVETISTLCYEKGWNFQAEEFVI